MWQDRNRDAGKCSQYRLLEQDGEQCNQDSKPSSPQASGQNYDSIRLPNGNKVGRVFKKGQALQRIGCSIQADRQGDNDKLYQLEQSRCHNCQSRHCAQFDPSQPPPAVSARAEDLRHPALVLPAEHRNTERQKQQQQDYIHPIVGQECVPSPLIHQEAMGGVLFCVVILVIDGQEGGLPAIIGAGGFYVLRLHLLRLFLCYLALPAFHVGQVGIFIPINHITAVVAAANTKDSIGRQSNQKK